MDFIFKKIKEFIDNNWVYATLAFVIVFSFCFLLTLSQDIVAEHEKEREKATEFSKTLTDSEKIEIFTSCYTSFDFNCQEAVKAYRKLKMK